MRRLLLTAGLTLIVIQGAGCGGSEETIQTSDAKRPEGAVAAEARSWKDLKRAAGAASGRLLVPHGPAPDQIVVRQLRAGKGPPLQQDGTFTANYMSFGYRTGKQLEGGWDVPPVPYLYSPAAIVKAWLPGLRGARAGEMRELIAPSHLVYENGARIYLVKVVEIKRR
jgi:peptidylprolyl isomerase